MIHDPVEESSIDQKLDDGISVIFVRLEVPAG